MFRFYRIRYLDRVTIDREGYKRERAVKNVKKNIFYVECCNNSVTVVRRNRGISSSSTTTRRSSGQMPVGKSLRNVCLNLSHRYVNAYLSTLTRSLHSNWTYSRKDRLAVVVSKNLWNVYYLSTCFVCWRSDQLLSWPEYLQILISFFLARHFKTQLYLTSFGRRLPNMVRSIMFW